jgi:DNA-binding FrmR family transcriptional regulator
VFDSPRLLARNSTRPHPELGTGYTDRPDLALIGEPEAVSVDEQAMLTARVHRARHEAELRELAEHRAAIQRELDWLHSQRYAKDVRTQIRAVQRQLDRIDQKLKH